MKTKPFPHQQEALPLIDAFRGRVLLAWDMGSGKSLTSLLWGQQAKERSPGVIVCPASLKWNWEAEAHRHFGLKTEILSTTRPPRNGLPRSRLYIINYDILYAWVDILRDVDPQLIILDECHYLAGRSSRRTRATRALCLGVPYTLALSGTPMTNRPAELWPTLNILRPDLFPSFWPYAREYCKPRLTRWGSWDVRGAANLEKLHGLLCQHVMLRKRKSEVIKDLPPKVRSIVPVAMSDPKEYDLANRNFLCWMRENAPGKVQTAARAESLVKLGYLKRLAAQLKMEAVMEWIDNYLAESDDKLVVFAVHKKIIAALRERYHKTCVVIDGSTSERDRKSAVYRFQEDSDIRVFIGNIKAAGVGLTLTAASTVVFVEVSWTPGEQVQGEDRCVLAGQKVLTPRGWRSVETLRVGDEVITRHGTPGTVKDCWERPCQKDVVELQVQGWPFPLLTTYDHRYLLQDGNWVEAGKLHPGQTLAAPVRGGSRLESIPFDPDCRPPSGSREERKMPDVLMLGHDALYTLGYYVGSGKVRSVQEGQWGLVEFQGWDAQEALTVCESWCKSLGAYVSGDGDDPDRRVYCGELSNWFAKYLGTDARSKCIPEFIQGLCREQRRSVLDGILAGAGHRRNGRWEFVATGGVLASQYVRLLLGLGLHPDVAIDHRDRYRISFSEATEGTGRILAASRRPPADAERVHDLEVTEDPSFTLGLSVVHNCHRIGQKSTTFVYYLVSRGTVEEKLIRLLEEKQRILSATLDGRRVHGDFDLYERLMRDLSRGNQA